MAGHSHWANIQHKKGAADKKRGKLFSKLSRLIIVAARNGGGDPDMNLRLRYAIDKARAVSMPKDNIERAIKKGTGELGAESLDEILYEGYAPGGVAVMAEVLTDNRNRTNGEIKKIFERGGAAIGTSGCVSYLFERVGFFSVPAAGLDEDALLSVALDAGASDMKREGDNFEITCDPSGFSAVQEALHRADITPAVAEVTHLPRTQVDVDNETGEKIVRFLELLDDHDDVQQVYSNANFSDEVVANMGRE